MKKAAILFVIIIGAIFAQNADKGSIELIIKHIDSNEGIIRIALFNNNDDYSKTGKAFKTMQLIIKDKKASCTFEDLPFGEYAIKLFHDENGNNELDTGLFGIPTEDYAFSNNATGNMGPASYEDAKFKLDKKTVTQKLSMQ